ncbi:MAG: cyclodeaminase/cyclohydrolase family protein [Bacilli bacterium]|nr:cyclodeaminase/cyclohydrolase family protein [Bacilli bacterium]MDD4407129.1 cyclodeaminase/cyclohydrolase family protein [Bacilli bacterium]
MTIKEFNEKLSSSSPTPGGGAVTSLISSIAISLSLMVANLTLGKKIYQENEKEIILIKKDAEKYKKVFYNLINKDEEAYLELLKSYKIPKDNINRDKNIEESLIKAALVPLEVLTNIKNIIYILETLMIKGNKLLISDVAIATFIFKSAAECSLMNIYINTKSMKNIIKAKKINKEADKLTTNIIKRTNIILNNIKKELL